MPQLSVFFISRNQKPILYLGIDRGVRRECADGQLASDEPGGHRESRVHMPERYCIHAGALVPRKQT